VIFQNNKVIYDQTFGYRDADSKMPMSGEEEYFIQSMTKPIISVALMTLYEEGRFQLTDPIEKYLPQFSNMIVVNNPAEGIKSGTHPAKTKITIAQLLSHTSGLSHGLTSSIFDQEVRTAIGDTSIKTIEQRVNRLARLPLNYDPGTKWNYSFSTDIISRLIEVLSGGNTNDFIQARVLKPLGMSNTGYNLNGEQQKRLMVVYNFQPDTTLVRSPKQPSASGNTLYAGVNALFSTTHDYLKFARMLLNGGELDGKRILKPATIEMMRQDYTAGISMRPDVNDKFYKLAPGIVINADGSSNLQPGYGFGLGFGLLTDSAKASSIGPAGEFFWNGANSTYFFINPKLNLIGIFMTQVGFVKNPFHFYYGDSFRQAVYGNGITKDF
jgi:CubicO group peptidase (beta-lactamase class C family)